MLTRRSLIGKLGLAPLAFAGPAWAGLTPPLSGQSAGWARFALGEFEITVVSDGSFTVPVELFGTNRDPAEVQAFLSERYLDPEIGYSHTNHIVIDTGDAKVLVDVGSGPNLFPTAGRLVSNLEAAGMDVADITHVALTHAHPDHVWGMMDDFGDELRFPEAGYTMGAAEFDWWTAEGRSSEVEPEMEGMVIGAQKALHPIAERMTMATPGTEVVSGIRMIDTAGHTPGHMSVEVESNGNGLLVLGDAATHAYLSFEHPDWEFGRDQDRASAARSRARILDRAATDRIAIAGYHLPFPGVGYVQRAGTGYRFLPATLQWGGS
jgi:glyoxylase-like metal-dependent hydrolase (beta-lactamase superfamily II)